MIKSFKTMSTTLTLIGTAEGAKVLTCWRLGCHRSVSTVLSLHCLDNDCLVQIDATLVCCLAALAAKVQNMSNK